jgi:hypothetical protein
MKVTVHCPRTGDPLQLSLPDRKQAVADSWKKVLRFSCPHCAVRHRINFRRAWAEGVAEQCRLDGASALAGGRAQVRQRQSLRPRR